MRKLSVPTARSLKMILWEHGEDWGRDAWRERMEKAPRAEFVRALEGHYVAKEEDDGLGDIPWILKMALLSAFHTEAGHLLLILANPETDEDDAADAGNDLMYVTSTIKWLGELPFSESECPPSEPHPGHAEEPEHS